jgi:hypothetical protein
MFDVTSKQPVIEKHHQPVCSRPQAAISLKTLGNINEGTLNLVSQILLGSIKALDIADTNFGPYTQKLS